MADEYQIQYEYSDGNTINIKVYQLKVRYHRYGMKISTRPDGKRYVDDPCVEYRVFTFAGYLDGDAMDTLDSVQMAAITYSGAYPRLKVLYWDGDSTETNIEVVIPDGGLEVEDMGSGWWHISGTMEEKTD